MGTTCQQRRREVHMGGLRCKAATCFRLFTTPQQHCRKKHARASNSIRPGLPGTPLTALATLGQQHDRGEGLQAELVGSKVALHVSLELGHSHMAASHLLRQLTVAGLQRL